VRVVNQSLPANGCPRFLKIDAHDDFHAVGKFLPQRIKLRRIFQRGFFFVNGTGADDDQHAGVFLAQNADDAFAAARDGGRHCVVQR